MRQEELNKQLIDAVRDDSPETVKKMLSLGADPNTKTKEKYWEDNSVLSLACILNGTEAVKMLLDAGADHSILDPNGYSLIAAVFTGNTDIVEMLLDAGADPNIIDHNGWGALHCVTRRTETEILHALLRHKADVNLPDQINGNTPMHYAAEYGRTDIMCILLLHDADETLHNKARKTPFEILKSHYRAKYENNIDRFNEIIQRKKTLSKEDCRENAGNVPDFDI